MTRAPRSPQSKRQVRNATSGGLLDWVLQPRTLVFSALALALLVGGGLRLWKGLRSRRFARRLADRSATTVEVAHAASHGRAVYHELMELLKTPGDRAETAALALSQLWAADELVSEEEQQIVLHGHDIRWSARRVYPRSLRAAIPISAVLRIKALQTDPNAPGIRPDQLLVSSRLLGARQLSLEQPSHWRPCDAPFLFAINPIDFPGRGPHTLELRVRVKTANLTSNWEMELPVALLRIEFDERLEESAICAAHDADRAAAISDAVGLQADPPEIGSAPLVIGDEFAITSSLKLCVARALPCDLVHRVALEIERQSSRVDCGVFAWLLKQDPNVPTRHPIAAVGETSSTFPLIEHAGRYRARAVLTPDPGHAWTNPDARSLWPEAISTNWVEVEIARR